jgi:hypothetical protein
LTVAVANFIVNFCAVAVTGEKHHTAANAKAIAVTSRYDVLSVIPVIVVLPAHVKAFYGLVA